MKTFLLFAFALLLCLSISACSSSTKLSGEVFVVTGGAGNYKLGLVKVSAIPEKSMASFFEQKHEADRSAAIEKVNSAQAALASAKDRLALAESKMAPIKVENLDAMERQHYSMREVENAKRAVQDAERSLRDAEADANRPAGPESYFGYLPPGSLQGQRIRTVNIPLSCLLPANI